MIKYMWDVMCKRIGHLAAMSCLFLGGGFLCTVSGAEQDKSAAQQRIEAVAARSTLEGVGHPWHLRMEVELPGEAQGTPEAVTIDRWQDGQEWRTVSVAGGATATLVHHGGKLYRTGPATALPEPAKVALDSVLHGGPTAEELAGTTPELRKKEFGKTSLDCIMLSRPVAKVGFAPLGLFPTYCLASSDELAISFDFGSPTVVRTSVGKFLDREITLKLDLLDGQKPLARAKVMQLATFSPKPEEFSPSEDMKPVLERVRISGGLMNGQVVQRVTPTYPETAKMNRVSGTVVLEAAISAAGHVLWVEPVSAPDPDLAIAAIAAVRRWVYRPYLLNGEATSVLTTVTVNFNRSPG